jgi:hypothetical protein
VAEIDWQAVVFFAFNAAFTAFNARIAWMNWRREEAVNQPSLEAHVLYEGGDVVPVELVYRQTPAVVWVPVRATLQRPRSGRIANPLQHLKVGPDNEPWLPGPIDVDWKSQTLTAALFVKERPGREQVWLKLASKNWPRSIDLDVDFESTEPQPRRYRIRVKRVIPAFAAVMAI